MSLTELAELVSARALGTGDEPGQAWGGRVVQRTPQIQPGV